MIGRLFRAHGEFCASHPWEVIVALLTFSACMLTVDKASDINTTTSTPTTRTKPCEGWKDSCEGLEAQYSAADVILMTTIRVTAILYCYYKFCTLQKLGSKYILGISGLFTVFSTFIFTTGIIKVLGSDVSDLKDALFFLLLLIDLSNSGILAQLALCGSNQAEVTRNIAHGMELLGPAISLDALVETLVIGIGTLSGVQRLETLCTFAVMSVIVNYIVFMTFYPACLSLILDLSRSGVDMSFVTTKAKDSILTKAFSEEEHKGNPAVQRVKVIMSTGLMVVHVYSRMFFSDKEYNTAKTSLTPQMPTHIINNRTETSEFSEYIIKWLSMSADQIVIFILVIALLVKFIFFENREELHDQIRISSAANRSVHASSSQPLLDFTMVKPIEKKPLFELEEYVLANKSTQTELEWNEDEIKDCAYRSDIITPKRLSRTLSECLHILNSEDGAANLTDDEITQIVKAGGGHCPLYKIESIIGHPERGVKIRRNIISAQGNLPIEKLSNLPYQNYDYTKVMNACCENVLGYVQIPVGYAGPLLLDENKYFVPMATTEGALVASTNRGCKALSVRGVVSYVEDVGMTRAPCVRFPNVVRAAEAKMWINCEDNFRKIKLEFDATSRFARLKELFVAMDGPLLYIRFLALTGDAMGMNMVSKGAERALRCVKQAFPDMQVVALSGNFCSDKKPAAINWIKGRGKRVVTECIVQANIVKQILKTDAKTLVECNKSKNLTGSALSGSIGGNNAHAANMVTAIFIATGQDPAQNVTSSNCSTSMECCGENGDDLYITCTMPSLEVGTVGGGTGLPGQSACLEMLGVRGANHNHPGENAKKLAQIICATVMAGEISLMAALVNNDLVSSHMRHNRSSVAINPNVTEPHIAVPSTSLHSNASQNTS